MKNSISLNNYNKKHTLALAALSASSSSSSSSILACNLETMEFDIVVM